MTHFAVAVPAPYRATKPRTWADGPAPLTSTDEFSAHATLDEASVGHWHHILGRGRAIGRVMPFHLEYRAVPMHKRCSFSALPMQE
jgi:hypothetical protein